MSEPCQCICAECLADEAERDTLRAEVERLRGLIAKVEWAAGEGAALCPWCEGALFHYPDCPAFSARGEVRR